MKRSLVVLIMIAGAAQSARAEVCSINAVTGVAFGGYDVFSPSAVVAAGSVTYACTGVLPTDRVLIELGGTTDASTPRTLTAGPSSLAYQLFLDPARTLVWGNGAGGTVIYGPTLPAEGTPTTVQIYGRIAARQDARAGSYSDTVLVSLQL